MFALLKSERPNLAPLSSASRKSHCERSASVKSASCAAVCVKLAPQARAACRQAERSDRPARTAPANCAPANLVSLSTQELMNRAPVRSEAEKSKLRKLHASKMEPENVARWSAQSMKATVLK